MSRLKLVGLAGSYNRPSKTFALVDHIATLASARYGFDKHVHDLTDVGPSLGQAQWRSDLDAAATAILEDVVSADVLVIGSPTYKGSYPGLFKHFIDLIDPEQLRAKPILISATGGGERHALMVEHQLRPLFGFFMAHTLPTAVYAADRDFADYCIVSEVLSLRVEQVVDELGRFLPHAARPSVLAAE